ncbi:hypothetical protein BOTBODRAFT_181712 [Botryobasidium botryosum FD-172 SS1]|uniref:Uncharacterized protein n=1 Tax=Botryobasidium botryosum (strain FD-172 SS1) TaxID=930990 RepID=A0A067LSV7_BOTB1|nr:hypothetical protein BOTBODRAFT_181712 [Botryobasidium botryosum FD-172 SS1]
MRPRRLLPIPTTLPVNHFSLAAHVFSGHCPSPYYYGNHSSHPFEVTCPCGHPAGTSAHTLHDCPLRHQWAPTLRAPAGDRSFCQDFDFYFPSLVCSHLFTWRWYAEHILGTPVEPRTFALRSSIAVHATAIGELRPAELHSVLIAEGHHDSLLTPCYHDYHRLRAFFKCDRGPSIHAARLRTGSSLVGSPSHSLGLWKSDSSLPPLPSPLPPP